MTRSTTRLATLLFLAVLLAPASQAFVYVEVEAGPVSLAVEAPALPAIGQPEAWPGMMPALDWHEEWSNPDAHAGSCTDLLCADLLEPCKPVSWKGGRVDPWDRNEILGVISIDLRDCFPGGG